MRNNSVVSSYPKSTGIPQVDGLSMGPPVFEASHSQVENSRIKFSLYFSHSCLYFSCNFHL